MEYKCLNADNADRPRRVGPVRLAIFVATGLALYGFAPQNGPPNKPGGAQGGFFSSGAPANTAGHQGAFLSSGAPAAIAGPQRPSAGTPPAAELAPFLADTDTKVASIANAEQAGDTRTLRQYLNDTDPVVESAAFDALFSIDPHSAVQGLLAIVRDTSQLTRLQSLQIIEDSPGVDDQTVSAALRSAAVDADPLLSGHALEVLAFRNADANGVGGSASGPQRSFASSGAPPGFGNNQGSFASSGAAANPGVAQPNMPASGNAPSWTLDDLDTKLAAVDEASQNGDRKALGAYLRDDDPAVQSAAFDALFALEGAAAADQLLAIIRDPTQLTRLQTLQLLNTAQQVDDQTARAALRSALSDADALVREYATAALAARSAGP